MSQNIIIYMTIWTCLRQEVSRMPNIIWDLGEKQKERRGTLNMHKSVSLYLQSYLYKYRISTDTEISSREISVSLKIQR